MIHKAPLCTEMYRIKKPFRKRYKPDRQSFSRDTAFLLPNNMEEKNKPVPVRLSVLITAVSGCE
ncbi:hypothetical protein C5952_00050 [Cronobacter sakazakii]|uniref:Uncharacterized protein n=1 Tax=Cronobacter sakazakii TaxID=28141 RepID=A0AAN5X5Q0_CROSK|nr:hypothetical protein CSK29544_04228 [Cronobacter sakazakii]KWU73927.1 hypothetical protein AGE04_23175 [Salmonella enterica subsp. enterica serovar Kentucky]CCK01331.1 hypothetical protein BN129_4062 [Cronobacter sakazakii 701]CCK12823.1 hypothetical protein BN126_3013 [Cronobacter sakazakii 680]AXX01149.1 hypothetical protein CsakCS09_03805 [Cronobacter sakazakii]